MVDNLVKVFIAVLIVLILIPVINALSYKPQTELYPSSKSYTFVMTDTSVTLASQEFLAEIVAMRVSNFYDVTIEIDGEEFVPYGNSLIDIMGGFSFGLTFLDSNEDITVFLLANNSNTENVWKATFAVDSNYFTEFPYTIKINFTIKT